MNHYEITYLSNPQLAEDARTQLDAAIDAKVADVKGTIEHASASLRRRTAYPINKTVGGFLRMVQIDVLPEHIKTIHDFLQKENNIVRFSILATPRRADVANEIKEKYVKKRAEQPKKKGGKGMPAKVAEAAAKPVTMEAVEKGIEEALTEEVK